MNRYIKISAALAAFALLLVVMGLSTSGSVNAQIASGTIQLSAKYVCSACDANNVSTITVSDGTADGTIVGQTVEVLNLDVARGDGH